MSDFNSGMGSLSLNDDSANGNTPSAQQPGSLKPKGADEAAAKALEAGWVAPTPIDYSAYANAEREEGSNGATAPRPSGNGFKQESERVWGATAGRYEWKDEYGDVAPADEELEKLLFEDQYLTRKGAHLDALKVPVTVESEARCAPVKEFTDAGLHPVMLSNIKLCQYQEPTPIQAYCIPAVLQNRDVIAVAQTGSGKTAAYMIPILSKLMGKAKRLRAPRDIERAEPLVLVVVPTRELAVQIFDEARRLCYRSMLRPCVAYGGGPVKDQVYELRRGCDILIGTPGRLRDFLGRPNLLTFTRLRYTVLDEADELVSDDWSEEIKTILEGCDSNQDTDHFYLMFSATFPKEARQLAREYLDEGHIRIRIGRAGSTHRNINQRVIFCPDENKRVCLRDLLVSMPPARTIVFVNNKRAADFVDDFLYNSGLPSTSIHSDRTQLEREDALRAFRMGKAPILVTTGVAARGLDIANVMHVINYDLPSVDHGGIHEYIHRIGRTGRIGCTGMSSSLYNERNEDLAPLLTKTLVEMGQVIPEFLEGFKPDGPVDKIDFEDDSEDEDNNEGGAEAGADARESSTGSAPTQVPSNAAPAPDASADVWGSTEAPTSGW